MADPIDDDGPRVRVERDDAIARIVLTRGHKRNAQDQRMLYELNDAFDEAAQDDDIRVVVLAADGPDFSSGHDLTGSATADVEPVGTWGGFALPGVEGCMAYEEELFLGLSWRWRNLPKPTIAEVHGRVIGGGLMLVWPCDLIVASEDAIFADPLVPFGVNGNEYFVHAFELGARKAKELLFLSSQLTSEEARQLGMVSRVVPRDELSATVTGMAQRICRQPRIGLMLAKQAVNQSQDAQGLWTAVQAAMSLHQLGHAHNRERFGAVVDPSGAETVRAMFAAERGEAGSTPVSRG